MKQSSAYRHLLNHKGFKTFQCYICDQSFLEKNALVKHSLSHEEDRSDRPFKCSICKEKFSNQLILEKHAVLHDSTRNFECDMCNYRYLTISYLRQHKENVHNSAISDEKYECPECDLILSSSIGMRRHMKRSGHQPYQCKSCPRRFWNQTRLEKHSQLHNLLRKFQCDICNYRFPDKSSLGRHLDVCRN